MGEDIDWTLTTWEGSRRRQHREFLALSFREKLQVVEDLAEVASVISRCVRERWPSERVG
jgi:hypothetical protein